MAAITSIVRAQQICFFSELTASAPARPDVRRYEILMLLSFT